MPYYSWSSPSGRPKPCPIMPPWGPSLIPVRSVTHPVVPARSELVRHGKMPVLHHEAGDGDEPMFLSIIEILIEWARRLGQILQSCSKLSD